MLIAMAVSMELISINIRLPGIIDTDVLQVVGAGIMVMFDSHKKLGTEFEDFLVMEEAKLTMGDHCSDLVIDDLRFERVYQAASNALSTVLAAQSEDLKSLANQVNGVEDIMMMEYPGIIKMYVRENPEGEQLLRYRLFNVC
ncbi:hypothetical protein SUREIYA_02590 [Serratia phage vB_SmaM-Sureiya]|nr:hypothetical protein SUREIYA_02590 [Serratia phage vB_SmaM-Sureiya]